MYLQLWDVLEAIWVYFVFPETKGPTLEEIAKIFDGEDAIAHIDMEQTEKKIQIHQDEAGREKAV
jgi:hypothetical protein